MVKSTSAVSPRIHAEKSNPASPSSNKKASAHGKPDDQHTAFNKVIATHSRSISANSPAKKSFSYMPPVPGSEAVHRFGSERRFALHELQKDWNVFKEWDGTNNFLSFQKIVDNPGKYKKSEVRAAQFFLDNPQQLAALDSADGSRDQSIRPSGIEKELSVVSTNAQSYALKFDMAVNGIYRGKNDLEKMYGFLSDNTPMSADTLSQLNDRPSTPLDFRMGIDFFLRNPDAMKVADKNGDGLVSINDMLNAGISVGVFPGWNGNGRNNGPIIFS
jgi:hypothetical protein